MKRLALSFILFALVAPAAFAAGEPDRTAPPKPGPARPLKLPPVQKFTLENGLSVWIVENHEVPIVTLALAVRSGATADPAGKPGLAAMTSAMLDEGAMGKASLQFDEEVSFLGATLTTYSNWDYSAVALKTPLKSLEKALPLFASAIVNPDFPAKELERLRKEALTELLLARSEPRGIASRAVLQGLFGAKHRYGIPLQGTGTSIASFSVDDLKSFHREHYRPNDAVLVASGDVTAADILPLLSTAFSKWEKGPVKSAALSLPQAPKNRKILLVDRPGSAQSVIRIALPGPARNTPEFFSLEVMNTLLGGSFTSRLNNNLREQKGYTYGAGSQFDMRLTGGMFLAYSDVQTDVTAPAMTEFMKELTRISATTPREDADRARTFAALGLGFEFETSDQVASQLLEQAIYALPSDFFTGYVDRALAIGPAEIQAAARKWLDTTRLTIIVVGDRAKIEKPLRDLKLGEIQIVPIETVMGPVPVIPAN